MDGFVASHGGEQVLQFENLLDHLPECIAVLNRKGSIVYLNAAWRRVLGPEWIEAAGLAPDASFIRCYEGLFQPNPTEKAALISAIAAGMRGSQETCDLEYVDSASGRRYYFAITVLSYLVNDEPGVLLQLRDVTRQKEVEEELRQGEERFRQMAENIREVFWMTDPHKNTMIYVSPAYEEIWGRSCESLYERSISFVEAIHEEDRERVIAAFPSQIEGTYDLEYRVVRPDGSIRWIRDRAFPIYNAEGVVYRVVGIAEDITERREAELALHRSARQEELIRAQAAVLAELSTPLFPVSDQVVVMPLIGTLDSQRTQRIMETLLRGVQEYRAQVAILDITGVPVVDSQVADALMRAAHAIRLLGAQVVLTGIRPEVAQTLVGLGIGLDGIMTCNSLQDGIAYALGQRHDSALHRLAPLN